MAQLLDIVSPPSLLPQAFTTSRPAAGVRQHGPREVLLSTPCAAAWRSEMELLLCCARAELDASCAERARDLLRQGIRWPALLQMARGQGVLPLLHRSLTTLDPEAVPDEVLRDFTALVDSASVYNVFRTEELVRLLHRLDADGIRALPFKGPVLSQLAYGDVRTRQFNDLDVLITQQDLPAAERILEAQGYVPDKNLRGLRKALFLQLEGEFPYQRGARIFRVDLHTRLGPRRFSRGLDFEALWQRALPVSLEGAAVPSLSLPDLLQVLCHHGSKHRWEALRYIADVADLIRSQPTLDWDAALAGARAAHTERMLLFGAFLSQALFEVALPPVIQQRMQQDQRLPALARELMANFFDVPRDEVGFKERLLFHLRVRDTLAAKVRYGAHALLLNSWTRARLGI